METPNTKLQTPEKLQAPSSKLEARAAVWSLELGISLVFGAWCLVFGSAESEFNLDSANQPLFHRAVSGKGLFFKYWLPVVLWMGLIFGGSTSLLSSQRTSRIIGPLLRWLNPNVSEETIRRVQAVVRKGGHVAEYSMLAALLWRARRKPFRNDPRPWSWREATLVVFYSGLYAATDEFHQWFVPSRGASVWDALLDTLAAAAGLVLLWRLGRGRRLW